MKLSRHCLAASLTVTVLALASTVNAYDVVGTFKNGTTGGAVIGAKVTLVNPSGGMMVEKETETIGDNGTFRFSGLDENATIYLIRAPYQGVNYTEIVRFTGGAEVQVQLTAYEPTTSWDDVSVLIPQLVISRAGADSLSIEKFFQITNRTAPPMTITGEDARFRFFVPGNNLGIHSLTTMSLGVPLPRSPLPTGQPDVYAVEYPIMPGETRVSLSYGLPYADGTGRYVDRFLYDVAEMMLYTDDPSMHVHCDYPGFARVEDVQGFAAYRVTNLQAGNEIIVDFEGGHDPAPTHGGGSRVFVLPATSNNLSLVALLVTFIVFAALLGFAIGAQREKNVERKVLHDRREQLLNQLARLEDLHQAGAVSDPMFKVKRTELMSSLAQIYYRTQIDKAAESSAADTAMADAKGARSV